MTEPERRPEHCASRPFANRRALVVDDNADNAESLAMLLHLHGYDTRTAHDGIKALELGERFRPGTILLDIGMPRMNGYEACRALRARPWGREAIIVAQTGRGQPEDRQRTAHCGFDGHLVKPIEFVTLTEMLTVLEARRAERTARAP